MYRAWLTPARVISDNTRMSPAPSSTPMTCTQRPACQPSSRPADCAVVPGRRRRRAAGPRRRDRRRDCARADVAESFSASPSSLLHAGHGRELAGAAGGADRRRARRARHRPAAQARDGGGLAARQRRVARAAFVVRGQGDAADLAQAVAEGLTLAEFDGGQLQDGRSARRRRCRRGPSSPIDASRERRATHRRGGRARPDPRRVQQPGARARQRAGQHADAARVRERARPRSRARAASRSRSSTRQQIEELGMGLLLGVARGSAEPPRLMVFRHDPPGAPADAGARPGRQGHHLRHRRHLDQAGRRHGADEGRHGGRRRGRVRDARDRAAEGADARHRRRADDGEHAGRPRDQAGRRPEERARARPSR